MTSLSISIPGKFLGDEPVAIIMFLASISWFPFSPITSILFFFIVVALPFIKSTLFVLSKLETP